MFSQDFVSFGASWQTMWVVGNFALFDHALYTKSKSPDNTVKMPYGLKSCMKPLGFQST
jgi:hypothetical protein